MRRRVTVLSFAAAMALAAGCSAPDDGDTAAGATDETVAPTTGGTDVGGAGGEESDEALQVWASEFCSAASPAFDVNSKIDLSSAGENTPESQQRFIVGLYDTFAEAFDESASGISSVDEPPVDTAQDFIPEAAAAFTGARDSLRGLRDDAQAVDLTDPAALELMGAGLQSLNDPLSAAFTRVDAITPPELNDVLTTVPECKALGG